MTKSHIAFDRADTFFGVCEAIGQDFGFNSNYVRAVFAVAVLLAPVAVIGTYAALGAMVFASRWIHPASKPAAPIAAVANEAPRGDNDAAAAPLAIAA